MAYWLYVTNIDNWGVTKRENTLGAARKYKRSLSRINIGDRILIYVKSQIRRGVMIEPSVIVGEYEAISKVFEGKTKIFHAPDLAPDELYKLRVHLKPIKLPQHLVEFKPLVPDLSFIKNKKKWALTIRGIAVLNIPEKDYTYISSTL